MVHGTHKRPKGRNKIDGRKKFIFVTQFVDFTRLTAGSTKLDA